MKVLLLTLVLNFTFTSSVGQEASFIGGDSMLDTYLRKYLSSRFEDVELTFDLQIDKNGHAHTPHIISPNNPDLQIALEKLVDQMPLWTPLLKSNISSPSSKRIFCWLEGNIIHDIDQSAQFPEGSIKMYQFISQQIPKSMTNPNAKVLINFVVDKNGLIRHPSIWQGYDEKYNNEALRIINLLPAMEPAIKKGVKVNSNYKITIYFR
ncbi:TonB protein C-terminal [Spirosomataceae bacterium TFI 002]|nr:TonB protein C-terminal [Spirosomataceae bacterium TFI 002]